MKSLICVSFLLLVAYASASIDSKHFEAFFGKSYKQPDEKLKTDIYKENFHSISTEWQHFKTLYGKSYKPLEEELRKEIFKENFIRIEEHNRNYASGRISYKLRINEFSDLSSHEFNALMNGYKKSIEEILVLPEQCRRYVPPSHNLPQFKDWRQEGAVTAVKNQGKNCGSCWAFSATGSLEGQVYLKKRKLISLSEQNLVDCSRKHGNHGCNGGKTRVAYRYIKLNGGIDTEKSYPYEGIDNRCRFKRSDVAEGAIVEGCYETDFRDENALKYAVALVGPIAAVIDATKEFKFYGEGIFNDLQCTDYNLTHAVLIVGYGSENGQDYWIVKNSWGESWGEQGYIRMSRNKNNQCGIASWATYPIVPN